MIEDTVHQIILDLREMRDELIGQIYVAENDPHCGITSSQLMTLKACLAETDIAILAWLDDDTHVCPGCPTGWCNGCAPI